MTAEPTRAGMSASRLAQIPIDHVVAEIVAFPLASEAALRLRVTGLSPMLDGGTRELWREAERQTLGSFPAFSVDEVVALRDRFWFEDRDRLGREVPLGRYLQALARLFLESDGGVAVPRQPDDLKRGSHLDPGPRSARARVAWRRLSFALPPDLLLAALGGDRAPGLVESISPTVDRMLHDRGYGEVHLHMGCALDFPSLWVLALRFLADAGLRDATFRSPGAQLGEGGDLARWLLLAATARYVLAAYLAWGRRPGRGLEDFVAAEVRPRLADAAGAGVAATLLHGLGLLLRGNLGDRMPLARLQAAYVPLTRAGVGAVCGFGQIQDADPIARLFPPLGKGRPTPEMRLVAEGLHHLDGDGAGDRTFSALFWQVLRVRALFYRHVVQRPMTPGLQWFIRFYGRMKAVARDVPMDLLFEAAAEQGGLRRGLRSLEVRTSPDPSPNALVDEIRRIERAAWRLRRPTGRAGGDPAPAEAGAPSPRADARDEADAECLPAPTDAEAPAPRGEAGAGPGLEFGLVLHFSRYRSERALKGIPDAHGIGGHGDPDLGFLSRRPGHPSGYRFARFYKEKRREATSLAWLLWYYPLSLGVVRGLDLCTDELGVPTWVFVPLIRHVREVGVAASAYLARATGRQVPPLRMTVHAGEDFVHLLTGLRHVHEVGFHRGFDLRQGDRIGHGLALGVDPHGWARRAGRIPLAREERLFDLAWEWAWYGWEGAHPPGGRQPVLEHEIARLSHEIFGDAYRSCHIDAYRIDTLVKNLHDPEVLRDVRFPDGPVPACPAPKDDLDRALLLDYLTDGEVFLRGRRIEWVDPADEGDILAAIQAGIRRTFGEYGIAVEVNPTSNLLIGDLQDLANHPLWRLRPPRPGVDSPPVAVCIGSDDPLTFGTNLRQEYQFLHDALTLAGLSDDEAFQWLDQTRASSLETRFTLPGAPGMPIGRLRRWDDLRDAPGLRPPP